MAVQDDARETQLLQLFNLYVPPKRSRKDRHWIFGFYDRTGIDLQYCHYASPALMAPWIREKEDYVRPDSVLEHSAPKLLTHDVLAQILGEKDIYTLEDARRVWKKQWTTAEYREAQDRSGGYSPERMLGILQARCAYVIHRGATLNNPHISKGYFAGWRKITEDHAATLRELVRDYLASKADDTDDATA
jgi:hypothetical protein